MKWLRKAKTDTENWHVLALDNFEKLENFNYDKNLELVARIL